MFAFTKALFAVLTLVSFTCATITIEQPNFIGNSTNTIKWSTSDVEKDPAVFSIELINKAFNSQFALANNVQNTQGSITFSLPVVAPGDGYSIEFVDIGNINNVFAQTGDFAIAQHDADTPLSSTNGGKPTGPTNTIKPSSVPLTVTQSSPPTLTSALPSTTAPAPSLSVPVSAASSAPSPSGSNAAAGLVPSGTLAALVAGILALAL